MRKGLASALIEESSIYTFLSSSIIRNQPPSESEYRSCRLKQLALRIQLAELAKFAALTQHEPRLRGPFPTLQFTKMIEKCDILLDALSLFQSVLQDRESLPNSLGEEEVELVKECIGQMNLCFYTLSGAYLLRAPLPSYLPNPKKARALLLQERTIRSPNEDPVYIFSLLVMENMIRYGL